MLLCSVHLYCKMPLYQARRWGSECFPPAGSAWSVCWDLEVMYPFPGRTCPLKSHTLTQECSEVINCLSCFYSQFYQRWLRTWDLLQLTVESSQNQWECRAQQPPQIPGRIQNRRADLEIWCDVSYLSRVEKKKSSNPWHTSIFIAIRISLCAFSTSRRSLLRSKDLTRWFNKLNKNIDHLLSL